MNSPFLIAVSSCQPDCRNGRNQAVRDTWGKVADTAGVDFIFTVGGNPAGLGAHEIGCDAPDGYIDLGYKSQFNARYALENGYEWMFQCFTDTYISIPRLLKEFEQLTPAYPIVGNFHFSGHEEDHPCGGSGYWIHRSGLELVDTAVLTPEIYAFRRHAEDRWVSWVLRQAGMSWHHEPRYDNESKGGGVRPDNANITNHLSFGHNYDPQWQFEEQRQELIGEASSRMNFRAAPAPRRIPITGVQKPARP